MASGNMKLKVEASEDIQQLMSTRVWMCVATSCRFNRIHEPHGSASCNLQRVRIGQDGRCESYELEVQNERTAKQ